MKDLQARVGEWHVATFGECSNKRIKRKLLEEAAEFMVAGDIVESMDEAGDVLIVLMAWAERNNVDLLKAAEMKFVVVKSRNQGERE